MELAPNTWGMAAQKRVRTIEVSRNVTTLEDEDDVIPVADFLQLAIEATVLLGRQCRRIWWCP